VFYVASVSRGTVNDGRTTQAPGPKGWGVTELGVGGRGRNELVVDSRVPPTRRERGGVRGKEQGVTTGQGARARRTGEGYAAIRTRGAAGIGRQRGERIVGARRETNRPDPRYRPTDQYSIGCLSTNSL
jgi:hypothetical protein